MATGYIPAADGSFDGWQGNFEDYVRARFGDLGPLSDVPTRLGVARSNWDKAYAEHTAARQAAGSDNIRQPKENGPRVHIVLATRGSFKRTIHSQAYPQ